MKTNKLIQGHGTNDLTEPVKINGKPLKFYDTWKGMLRRCYSEKRLAEFPTYRNCTVCDSWLLLSTFRAWFDINYRDGMELDKDILIQGNKVYSPEACSFVPQYINTLLTNSAAARGSLPLGVRAIKMNLKTGKITTTYEARCGGGNGKPLTKVFRTIPEAVAWYSTKKREVVEKQAIHAFEAGDINGDVYQALISRQW